MAVSHHRRVVVVGGGIAGAAAAERLAGAGVDVTLVERQPRIGGQVAQMGCKAAGVCLRCNVCVAVDVFKAVLRSPRIEVLTRARLTAFEPDGRTVIAMEPGFVRRERCTGCGVCIKACPQGSLQPAWPAAYGGQPVLQAEKCLRTIGQSCERCAQACPVDAIDLKEKPRQLAVSAAALVVAAGYEPFNPATDASWGCGAVANVITGVEAEGQLARFSRITRPSDGQPPKRVAFIQCVGSRSEHAHRRPEDTDYCSAVCCAYALRMARRVLDATPDAAVTVFYMDLQKFGKDFSAFLGALQSRVTLIRGRPYEVSAGPRDSARVGYEDQAQGAVAAAEFDLVVLAVGMRPAPETAVLADRLRISTDAQGFLGNKGAGGLADSGQPRIFLAGACEAPKDIAASISQAEAVVTEVLNMQHKSTDR